MISKSGTITTSILNQVATIEFSHPASNSFPSTLLQELTDEINTLSKNDSASIIILKVQAQVRFVLEPLLMNYFQ